MLPPTVLGFYVLVAIGSRSPLGRLWNAWTGHGARVHLRRRSSSRRSSTACRSPCSRWRRRSRSSIRRCIEASATLGASPLAHVHAASSLPLSIEGVLAGAVLSFAHTLGEFGVVLMVGGNLPGVTRTVSISIYDQVQALQLRRRQRDGAAPARVLVRRAGRGLRAAAQAVGRGAAHDR